MAAREWLAQELLRHARRRLGGMTTVSVVVGDKQSLQRELAAAGTRVAATRAQDVREMAVDFLAQLPTSSLTLEALSALGIASSDWEYRSSSERSLALDQAQSKPLSTEALLALRWLQAAEGDPLAQLACLSQWRSGSQLPMLALSGPAEVLAQGISLAESAPQLAVAFLVDADQLATVINAQTSRARALLADSIVRADLISGGLRTALEEPELEQLRQGARRAQESLRSEPTTPEAEDRARSAVERFLYQLLQSTPRTRDVFELNAALPFHFGGHRLEADFAARSLRLVLEVDGYFHFTNPDAYRRDRRKDVLLQQQGYLVARFLADDVLERTAWVMRLIEQLVISRTHHGQSEED